MTDSKKSAHSEPAHADPHPAAAAAAAPHPEPAAAPPPDHPPPAPVKEVYRVPRTFAGQKGKLELEIVKTAGGDVKFIVGQVTNAIEPVPGAYLTLDQVEAIGGAGWEITAVAHKKEG